MNQSVKQYIDLVRENRETLDAPAPHALNVRRDQAMHTLLHVPMPRKGDEGLAVSDLQAMFAPDFGVNIARIPFRADLASAFRCEVPNISTLMGVTANDIFGATDSLRRLLPEGVILCSFREAEKSMPGILEKFYGRLAPDGSNPAVALNTLLAQDGVMLHVRSGVRFEKTLQLVNILGGTNAPMLAARRMLVVIEDNAECRLLVCDHSHDDGVANALNFVTEIFVGDNARFEYYDLEESSPLNSRYASINATLGRDAALALNVTTLRCGRTRNEISVTLPEPGADCRLSGIAIADGTQVADNVASVYHNAPRCHSDQLFKYIIEDSANGGFEGIIRVADHADHTEAYQNNRNVLASPEARMHTQPQLEIYCDDVKCSHGAATGRIDERALFYMRSRGIPEHEARVMLMQAFMADVLDRVSLTPLRDRLRHLVENRLTRRPAPALCSSCK